MHGDGRRTPPGGAPTRPTHSVRRTAQRRVGQAPPDIARGILWVVAASSVVFFGTEWGLRKGNLSGRQGLDNGDALADSWQETLQWEQGDRLANRASLFESQGCCGTEGLQAGRATIELHATRDCHDGPADTPAGELGRMPLM